MIPPRRRLIGLTVLPVLLVAGVLATVIAVGAPGPASDRPPAVLPLAPIVEVEPDGCRRDHDNESSLATPLTTQGLRVSSAVIVSCPSRFDGLRVTFVGEAIGDLLDRQDGAWVLVNDDDYALMVGPLAGHGDHHGSNAGLSVWLPDPLPARLTGLGRPGVWGDVIEVTGRIVRTDPTDGGGLTLRAEELTVLQPSHPIDEPLDRELLVLATAALMAAGFGLAMRHRATGGRL